MSVRVWFEEDIKHALDAAAQSAMLLPSNEFRDGMFAELAILRTAFGIEASVQQPIVKVLLNEHIGMLEVKR